MTNLPPEFTAFPKMPRMFRRILITEKIDGTNAQILVTPEGDVFAGSRTRWITPTNDNFGFAAWVRDRENELRKLGPGRHFGEWWGKGIQRGYGLKHRKFSLFNTIRWCPYGETPKLIETADPRIEKWQDRLPSCCDLVPVLYDGLFSTDAVTAALHELREVGSIAAPGFRNPEGVVVFHVAGNTGFKVTLENDDQPKGAVKP